MPTIASFRLTGAVLSIRVISTFILAAQTLVQDPIYINYTHTLTPKLDRVIDVIVPPEDYLYALAGNGSVWRFSKSLEDEGEEWIQVNGAIGFDYDLSTGELVILALTTERSPFAEIVRYHTETRRAGIDSEIYDNYRYNAPIPGFALDGSGNALVNNLNEPGHAIARVQLGTGSRLGWLSVTGEKIAKSANEGKPYNYYRIRSFDDRVLFAGHVTGVLEVFGGGGAVKEATYQMPKAFKGDAVTPVENPNSSNPTFRLRPIIYDAWMSGDKIFVLCNAIYPVAGYVIENNSLKELRYSNRTKKSDLSYWYESIAEVVPGSLVLASRDGRVDVFEISNQ